MARQGKAMQKTLFALAAVGMLLFDFESVDPINIAVGPLVPQAEARIGAPWTPLSVGGVARRTTRRVIRRSAIYVATLPRSCTTVIIEGTTLQSCGGTYYQPYGNQYVVVYVD